MTRTEVAKRVLEAAEISLRRWSHAGRAKGVLEAAENIPDGVSIR